MRLRNDLFPRMSVDHRESNRQGLIDVYRCWITSLNSFYINAGDSVNVRIFENQALTDSFELFPSQACEYECIGRNTASQYLKAISDLSHNDRVFCAFKRRLSQVSIHPQPE